MKTNLILRALVLSLCVLCVGLFSTGCASRSIDAASTRLKVSNPIGQSIEIALPKNLNADKLAVEINPETRTYKLTADKLVTDASTVIDSASAAQAQAIANLTGLLGQFAPLLVPQLKPQQPPANP